MYLTTILQTSSYYNIRICVIIWSLYIYVMHISGKITILLPR